MRPLSFFASLSLLLTAGMAAAQTTAPIPAPSAMQQAATTPSPFPAPPPAIVAENVWNLDLSTGGRVSIQLRPDIAPAHVERIRTLTGQGFYNGLIFHRVIEGFMAQAGDPTGTGSGGSPLPDLAAEIRGLPHLRGAVAMARAESLDSANSQFYIMFVPRLSMDRNYTVFGRVIGGMNFVDAIERGEPPLSPTRIVRASMGSDNLPELSADELRAAAARMAAAAAPAPGARAAGTLNLPAPDSRATVPLQQPAGAQPPR
jgi:cyclophilin family peptidyl-prolyl cis-trans isomerase